MEGLCSQSSTRSSTTEQEHSLTALVSPLQTSKSEERSYLSKGCRMWTITWGKSLPSNTGSILHGSMTIMTTAERGLSSWLTRRKKSTHSIPFSSMDKHNDTKNEQKYKFMFHLIKSFTLGWFDMHRCCDCYYIINEDSLFLIPFSWTFQRQRHCSYSQ